MSDELRAAAERILDGDMPAVDQPLWIAKSIRELCRFYLREHPSDDSEPVTEEWLRAVGFRLMSGWPVWFFRESIEIRIRSEHDSEANPAPFLRIAGQRIFNPTRGDVRRLCAALGVALEVA